MTSNSGPIVHVTTVHRFNDNRIFRKEVRALHDVGVDVRLVASHEGAAVVDGVQIHRLPTRSGRLSRMVGGSVATWRELRRLRPSVVHAHDPELIPLLMAWKWRHRSVTVVFDAHEDLPKQVMGKTYLPLRLRAPLASCLQIMERGVCRRLDLIVAATPSIAAKFPAERTVLVQNFPWLREFPAPTPAPGAFTLCYVGGISHGRGIQETLSGMRASKRQHRLILAGPIVPEAATLLREYSDLKIDYRGLLSADEIPSVIAESSVGLALLRPLPNYLESQATKIFEYMASGRPFIASDFPAWRAMFEPFNCGLFVDPSDPEAVATALRVLADDPSLAAEMGQRGRQAMENHFTFEAEAERLIARVVGV